MYMYMYIYIFHSKAHLDTLRLHIHICHIIIHMSHHHTYMSHHHLDTLRLHIHILPPTHTYTTPIHHIPRLCIHIPLQYIHITRLFIHIPRQYIHLKRLFIHIPRLYIHTYKFIFFTLLHKTIPLKSFPVNHSSRTHIPRQFHELCILKSQCPATFTA